MNPSTHFPLQSSTNVMETFSPLEILDLPRVPALLFNSIASCGLFSTHDRRVQKRTFGNSCALRGVIIDSESRMSGCVCDDAMARDDIGMDENARGSDRDRIDCDNTLYASL